MNGALGDDRNGRSSTLRTVNEASARPSASERARRSSSAMTLALGPPRRTPVASKSFPVATRISSTATSVAMNDGEVAVTSSMSQ
jgi:hypothetical protein